MVDYHGMLPGESLSKHRLRARQSCDLTLQLLSPNFEADGLAEERTPRFLPVLLHDVLATPEDISVFSNEGRSFEERDTDGRSRWDWPRRSG